MNNENDKVSVLMDDESRDSGKILDSLSHDKEMRDVWQRYHLIRDAMKGQLSEHPELDISDSVHKALENEAVILIPVWRRLNPRFVMKQVAGLAVAAAVGTIAVLSVQQAQLDTSVNPTIAQSTNISSQLPGQIRTVAFTTRKKLDAAVESKLSGYLVNHNEFSTSFRVSGVMPYTRIVSFVPSASSEQVNNDK